MRIQKRLLFHFELVQIWQFIKTAKERSYLMLDQEHQEALVLRVVGVLVVHRVAEAHPVPVVVVEALALVVVPVHRVAEVLQGHRVVVVVQEHRVVVEPVEVAVLQAVEVPQELVEAPVLQEPVDHQVLAEVAAVPE
jgi:hypothetical protein